MNRLTSARSRAPEVDERLGLIEEEREELVAAPNEPQDQTDEALAIARRRYASGEISPEGFDRLRSDLAKS
jgi:uncharacterized membrane protein